MKIAERRVQDDSPQPQERPAGWVRRLIPFVKGRRKELAVVFAAAIGSQVITAVIPLIKRAIVDEAILGGRRSMTPLLTQLGVLALVRFGISFVRRYSGAKVGLAVEFDLRNTVYRHLQNLDFARHDEMQTGQLVSRASGDVRMVQSLLGLLPAMSANVIFFFVSLVLMLQLSPKLTIVALVIVPVLLVMALQMRRIVYPSSWDASANAAGVSMVIEEAITGVRIVKGFGQERRELARLMEAASKLFGARMRNTRISAKRQASMQIVPSVGQLAILGIGGYLALRREISVGTFLAFMSYLVMLIAPVQMFARMLVQAQNTRAAAERIFELLDATSTVVEKPDAETLPKIEGDIVFEDIGFGYLRSEPVLDGFSLHVRPGEAVALVGGSGSGKSTVAMILPRFYDVQQGAVLVDGHDIRDVTLDSLRSQIGVVFEESFLFSDTVRNNIAYGRPDASPEDVVAAAKAAEAHDFVMDLPEGYDTVVGERGLTLSGGQRQRIALARALITDPRVLVLDDATSSIDAKIEEEIHATLRRIMPGRSVVLVAHRRSTLDLANRIVVMERGRELDNGTHAELLARCPLYSELLSGPGDSAEGGEPRWDGEITEDAWRDPPIEEIWGWNEAQRDPTGRWERFARWLGIRGGPGSYGVGQQQQQGRRLALNQPPTRELAEAIDKLPPVVDTPEIDLSRESAPHDSFSLPSFIRPFSPQILVGLSLVTLTAIVGLAAPYITRWGVDHGIMRQRPTVLWQMCGVFLASVLLGRVLGYAVTIYTGRTGQRMLFALRVRVWSHLQRLGIDYYDSELAGRIMTRMTTDIEAMNALLQSGVIQSVVQLVTFFGTAAILFHMNARLAWYVMVIAPPLVVATQWYRVRSDKIYLKTRDRLATVNATFQESISGVRVAQAYVREERNADEFRRVTENYLEAQLEGQRVSSTYFPFIELLSTVAELAVFGVGASMVARSSLSAGALIAFSLYINTVFAPIQQLSAVFDTYQQAKASMTRLRELFSVPVNTPEAAAPVAPGRLTGDVVFEDVRFRYPRVQIDALVHASLHIRGGESVALVGETGAGKSTIVKLIARFYDATSGRILVDGRDIRGLDLEAYRRQLGYVPQEAFLFSGTIRDNLAYGRPEATFAEIEAAARAVGAHEFIARQPYGYFQDVTERGRSLSSGQRQLMALARALIVDPAILILDEATANLDLSTEAKVTEAMGAVAQGRTTILIAHRLQTARRADRILVIDHGHVVEEGTHDELVERGGRYAELWLAFAMEAPPEYETPAEMPDADARV